jgi:hypothetical protein
MTTLEAIQIQTERRDPHTTDVIVLAVLDEVLADLLGRRVREAIYDYMAREHHIAKEELPNHMDELNTLLESTFGKGAQTIKKMVAGRLSEKIGRGDQS